MIISFLSTLIYRFAFLSSSYSSVIGWVSNHNRYSYKIPTKNNFMVALEKNQIFSLGILGYSFIGIILLLVTDLGGFWLTGYYTGERYSCLFCEYGSVFDRIVIILLVLLLLGQGVIGLNNSLSQRFFPQKLETLGLLLAASTVIFTIIGGISIAIEFADYEWWFETGFYTGLIVGLINGGMFFLLRTKKE